MSAIQEFETALNEVVQARRLSQSKMTKLTEVTMKLMEHDTQLVSMMYRTHKSLPTSCKISSLYVFDALSRAARQQVLKHNLSERHGSGNCATFLLKVAGVLEGLFQDMLAIGTSEAKEKTKKIHDIWVKGATFPPDILSRLSDIVSGKDKEPRVNASVTTDSLSNVQTSPAVSAQPTEKPVAPTVDAQVTLLALLTQAAGQQVMQTTANTVASSTTSAVDPTHLLLQYLQSASVNSTPANQLSPTTSQPVSDTPVSQVSTDPRIIFKPSVVPHTEPVRDRQSPRHDSCRSPHPEERYYKRGYDDRTHTSNDPRENPRRRGRWNRWDEREPNYQRDANSAGWSPRGGPNRSHSPEGRASRMESPSPSRHRPLPPRTRYKGSSPMPGKDEFGRDLRPLSPSKSPTSNPASIHSANISLISPSAPHDTVAGFSSTPTSNVLSSGTSSVAAKDPSMSDHSVESNSKTTLHSEMDNFDISAFDPTSPTSWEALGKIWKAMNGYTPSTEELMQFMMMNAMNNATQSKGQQQIAVGGNEYGNGYERGAAPRGRGGYGELYGDSRNKHHEWSNGSEQATDAVVLGGGEVDVEVPADSVEVEQLQLTSSEGRLGGKMQKVGDRWVFVRSDSAA